MLLHFDNLAATETVPDNVDMNCDLEDSSNLSRAASYSMLIITQAFAETSTVSFREENDGRCSAGAMVGITLRGVVDPTMLTGVHSPCLP